MSEFLDVVLARHSSRGPFDPAKPVAENDLRKILEAARWAPTANNSQNFQIVAVDDPALIGELGKLQARAADNRVISFARLIDGSPLLLIVIYDPAKRVLPAEGGTLGSLGLGCVMENIWLAAQDLGVGLRVIYDFSDQVASMQVKNLLKIPDNLEVAYGLRLGYPSAPPEEIPRERRPLNEVVSHNSYNRKGLS